MEKQWWNTTKESFIHSIDNLYKKASNDSEVMVIQECEEDLGNIKTLSQAFDKVKEINDIKTLMGA